MQIRRKARLYFAGNAVCLMEISGVRIGVRRLKNPVRPAMSTSHFLSPQLVAAISVFLGIRAAFAQEILTIEDQGAKREFELVEDEVLLTGNTENGARLREDVEAA